MRVQDLQQFLSKFTEGSDAIKNAHVFVEVNGKLADVRRLEVHENSIPIVGHKGHVAHRLVIKTQKPSSIILPEKLQKDYLMDDDVPSKTVWAQRLNYIKNFVKFLKKFRGLELKTLVVWGLLIYWATILLAPFSQ